MYWTLQVCQSCTKVHCTVQLFRKLLNIKPISCGIAKQSWFLLMRDLICLIWHYLELNQNACPLIIRSQKSNLNLVRDSTLIVFVQFGLKILSPFEYYTRSACGNLGFHLPLSSEDKSNCPPHLQTNIMVWIVLKFSCLFFLPCKMDKCPIYMKTKLILYPQLPW